MKITLKTLRTASQQTTDIDFFPINVKICLYNINIYPNYERTLQSDG